MALIICGGVLTALFGPELLQQSPLNSLYSSLNTFTFHGATLLIAILGALALINAITHFRSRALRAIVVREPKVMFVACFLLFFIMGNIGVSGDINFYEHYIFQAIFFVGVTTSTFKPKYAKTQLYALVTMLLFINAMLWRYAA